MFAGPHGSLSIVACEAGGKSPKVAVVARFNDVECSRPCHRIGGAVKVTLCNSIRIYCSESWMKDIRRKIALAPEH